MKKKKSSRKPSLDQRGERQVAEVHIARLSPVFRPAFPVGPLAFRKMRRRRRRSRLPTCVCICVYIYIYIYYILYTLYSRSPSRVFISGTRRLLYRPPEEFRLFLQKCHASPPARKYITSRWGFLDLRAFYEFSAARHVAWSLPG
jgi:hypothetical protein